MTQPSLSCDGFNAFRESWWLWFSPMLSFVLECVFPFKVDFKCWSDHSFVSRLPFRWHSHPNKVNVRKDTHVMQGAYKEALAQRTFQLNGNCNCFQIHFQILDSVQNAFQRCFLNHNSHTSIHGECDAAIENCGAVQRQHPFCESEHSHTKWLGKKARGWPCPLFPHVPWVSRPRGFIHMQPFADWKTSSGLRALCWRKL